MMRAAGVDDEAAQGDVQLHQEPAPGGGRPERPPVGPHGHHGPQQPRRRDHPQPPPLAAQVRPLPAMATVSMNDLSSI